MTTARRLLRLAVLAAAVLSCGPLAGPARAQGAADFRIEYSKEAVPRAGWAVEGYVYNGSRYLVSGVRLRVEVLEASGAVIGESFGWVYGNVPSNGRAYFVVPLPRRGADYRISIVSFTQNSVDAP